ncbi:MAG: hypothetical protein RIC30_03290 [Marinoscillum sp.]|uniref:hypothetical protein n=1 Tax=Marinoscillum sp. TaxID=2024838 RepID=UPI0032F8B4D0
MKIHLSKSTAGRGGGAGLHGMLKHLDRHIQSRFEQANFQSSFKEIWLTLSYPPLYVLPGVVGMEKGFMEHYQNLPISRLDRKYSKVDITLQAPEFSEHYDKNSQENYEHRFSVEERFQNIEELELAKILIDKYIESGQIISKKIKKGDDFDFRRFNEILLSIKSDLNADFLTSINDSEQNNIHNEALTKALNIREVRRANRKEKDKVLRDLRIYYCGLPNKALYPYDYQYTEIFRNLLIRKHFKCPTYHHVYIQVAQTEEEALKNTFAFEDWYSNCISLIDYRSYSSATEEEKTKMVFDLISKGLKDIVELDGLDQNILSDTIKEVELKHLDTELAFRTYENKKYELRITYLSRSMEEKCPIFFNVLEKDTGRNGRVQIGTADNSQISLWLQKVTLTNNSIRIKSSDSIRGQVWLKDKPREMEFNWDELLSEKSL